mmetsp:Transcript_40276/g.128047  ORF Transcript_40276/g.128047 Transcript_40276/m.128047 type:complete len:411 (-) Transcript_40276:71-1303(-)
MAVNHLFGTLGLHDVAKELSDDRYAKDRRAQDARAVFDVQQALLTNIMVVSALLLGFIVTGTMLSISLTGSENFGMRELIEFFHWSSLAATFSFLSLITSFLTSVFGTNFMITEGPEAAARALTQDSVLKQIIAEGSLYLSMFFFLGSMNCYVSMVYTGPDICPSYRGIASLCARQGADLYEAAASVCNGTCAEQAASFAKPCDAEADQAWCLCKEYCKPNWEERYDWSKSSITRHPGVEVFYRNWFLYGSSKEHMTDPAREKMVAEAAAIMCQHHLLEARKEACFKAGVGGCDVEFSSWDRSEQCMEQAVADAEKCRKVCTWNAGYPPREALERVKMFAFLPLAVMILLMTIGRAFVITLRAIKVCRENAIESHRHVQELGGEDHESSSESAASAAHILGVPVQAGGSC